MNVTTVTAASHVDPSAEFAKRFTDIWHLIVAPAAIVLNLIVLITFARVKKLVPPTTRVLMIHQSFVELVSSAVVLIRETVNQLNLLVYPSTDLGDFCCVLYMASYWSIDTVLQLNNMVITLDRYFAVCHVFKKIFTKQRILVLVAIMWLIGILFNFLNYYLVLYVTNGKCVYKTNLAPELVLWYGIAYLIFDGGPALCVIIFYPQMVFAIKHASKAVSSNSDGGGIKSAATARLMKTCLIAAVVLIICNSPDFICYCIMYTILNIDILNPVEQSINLAFKATYPFLSPIIYSLSTAKFQAAILVAFGFRKSTN